MLKHHVASSPIQLNGRKIPLQTMLRKHAGRFGLQWDHYSPVFCMPIETLHASIGEKPSFLLFGTDCCRSASEVALLPPNPIEQGTVETYREELILNLSSAQELAAKCQHTSQATSKLRYDQKVGTRVLQGRVGLGQVSQ